MGSPAGPGGRAGGQREIFPMNASARIESEAERRSEVLFSLDALSLSAARGPAAGGRGLCRGHVICTSNERTRNIKTYPGSFL